MTALQRLAERLLTMLDVKIAALPTWASIILAAVGVDSALAGLHAMVRGQLPTLPQAAALAVLVISLAFIGEDLELVDLALAVYRSLARAGLAAGSAEVLQSAQKVEQDLASALTTLRSLAHGTIGFAEAAGRFISMAGKYSAAVGAAIETYVSQVLAGTLTYPVGKGGTKKMAVCSTWHSARTQGAGLCCSAVASGALTPPAPGTTLPPYAPGQAATLPAGRSVMVTDSGGHCGTCMIVGSRSTKHPGKPVLRYVRGGPGCPTAGTGCCAMAA